MTLPVGFDAAPVLQGRTLALRPLAEADRSGLTQAAADPEIWAGHPAKDRADPAKFNDYFTFLRDAGGSLVITEADSGRIIGVSRFYTEEGCDDLAIGFTFLVRDHWGGASNAELKALMLTHAFKAVDDVWFHIAPDNIRSQKATGKLGAVLAEKRDLSSGIGPKVPYLLYRLVRADWQASGAFARFFGGSS